MKPGCSFMYAASSAHTWRKRPVSSGARLNWLMRTTGPSSSCSCRRYVTWLSISRSFIAVLSPRAGLVLFDPAAKLAECPCGGRQVCDAQTGRELVDPVGLPLVNGRVLVVARLGEPDQG